MRYINESNHKKNLFLFILLICIIIWGCKQFQLEDENVDGTSDEIVNADIPNIVEGERLLLSTYGESVRFECLANSTEGAISYQWYKFDDVSNEEILLENENHSYYETEEIERGIFHYICKVTNTI